MSKVVTIVLVDSAGTTRVVNACDTHRIEAMRAEGFKPETEGVTKKADVVALGRAAFDKLPDGATVPAEPPTPATLTAKQAEWWREGWHAAAAEGTEVVEENGGAEGVTPTAKHPAAD